MAEPARANAFPFRHAIQVSLRDLDALGHVNHAVYLSYLEVARTNYYFALCGFQNVGQLDFVLGSVSCRYRSPSYLHEMLLVSVGPSEIGRKSWGLRYEVREEKTGRFILDAQTTQVQYDYSAGRSVEIPEHLRALLIRDRIPAGG